MNAHPLPGVPLSTKPCRQSTKGATRGGRLGGGALATNKMETQSETQVFYPGSAAEIGVIPTSCSVLYCCMIEYNDVFEGGPLPSLYSLEDEGLDLKTNPSRLQLP